MDSMGMRLMEKVKPTVDYRGYLSKEEWDFPIHLSVGVVHIPKMWVYTNTEHTKNLVITGWCDAVETRFSPIYACWVQAWVVGVRVQSMIDCRGTIMFTPGVCDHWIEQNMKRLRRKHGKRY